MVQLIVDSMDNTALWSAVAPDGITPSTDISLSSDTTRYRFGSDHTSGRIAASHNALDHSLRRALPNIDLTAYDELRLWIWSDRVATPSQTRPFFMEVRLASAATSLQDSANTWSRYLPVSQPQTWELVRLSLDDLPTPVRSAANLVALQCIDATVPFTCYLDDVLAVREEMIGDADAALLALLNGRISISGVSVPAAINHPENPPALTIPSIRITQYDIQYARDRTLFTETRGDFGPSGLRVLPSSIGYDLYYAIDVYANTRPEKTRVMEFVLSVLSPRVELVANGIQLPLEWMTIEPLDDEGKWRSDRELLYFKVATRQEVGAPTMVVPAYQGVTLCLDQTTRP